MILRVTIANITPEDVAEWGQREGISGTAWHGVGFGTWGQETGTTIEFALRKGEFGDLRTIILRLLTERKETAAYVTLVGTSTIPWAGLWYEDGRYEVIE